MTGGSNVSTYTSPKKKGEKPDINSSVTALLKYLTYHEPAQSLHSNSQNNPGKLDLTAPHFTDEERVGREVELLAQGLYSKLVLK